MAYPTIRDHGAAHAWPNECLIGFVGSRARLDTPALLIDEPTLMRNIAQMAERLSARGVALRPHVKAHKSIEIARRQVAAGAIGVACATLGEAEVMGRAGIDGVLLTTPVVTEGKIGRLVGLAASLRPGALLCVADHADEVDRLDRAAAGLGWRLPVLVDHAAGYGRTGAADAEAAIALADRIVASAHLRLAGLQSYAGHIQHIVDAAERGAAATELHRILADLLARAAARGLHFEIVTGGGTGTHLIDAQSGVFTEVQPGSYALMDAEYAGVREPGGPLPFEVALLVQASVVSVNAPGWVTVDGGGKCFATDSGVPIVRHGLGPNARYAFFGDEHGKLTGADPRPPLGARIEFVTPHCDPTVNLHDVYHVVRDDTLVAIWPVDARGER